MIHNKPSPKILMEINIWLWDKCRNGLLIIYMTYYWDFSCVKRGVVVSWLYGSWIYNYLCNQCLSVLVLTLWVWIPLRRGVLSITICDKVCQWLAADWWVSLGTPVSSTNKTDNHDIAEILLKVALNTTTLTHVSGLVIGDNRLL